uniref:Protein kinase domain-containing protein n=1 Tax=Salix viminalis TaxID=40686 RepID=A0A6N2N2M8_SALVM
MQLFFFPGCLISVKLITVIYLGVFLKGFNSRLFHSWKAGSFFTKQFVGTVFIPSLYCSAGLQVLQEKHLIHRDLKPQNLLLSSNDLTPQLKIGDFGFARSLTSSDLADTLCGSPLYMAPEIIQNKKYDAKADLWSVGAVLFQLVTGKPPFDGNSQYQLFQNILTSTELRFPQGALEELHPDCVDLCRGLLRRNPVERLTFKEFFNHKFLGDPMLLVSAKSSPLPQVKSAAGQFDASASDSWSYLEHDNHNSAGKGS